MQIQDEDIDGAEFFSIEMWIVERLRKGIKDIKKFHTLWSQETNMVCHFFILLCKCIKRLCWMVLNVQKNDSDCCMKYCYRVGEKVGGKIQSKLNVDC